MIKLKSFIRMAAAALLLTEAMAACGDSESFTVEGRLEDNATMNIRYIYYTNGVLNRGVTASRGGKFEFKGMSPTPTILEITDNDYRPLGRLYISNGNRIECTLTRGNPNAIKVSGSDVNSRWAGFLNENVDALKGTGRNRTVEQYVAAHPDDIVSTLLMLTVYDSSGNALRADSVMSSINQDKRPAILVEGYNSMLQRLVAQTATEAVVPIPYFSRRDSLVTFNPAARPWSLFVLSDEMSGRGDSIVPTLRRISRLKDGPRIQIVDISTDRDTVRWHRSTLSDSAVWKQGWVAGSLASSGIDRLGIPRLPYFIVIDSTGTQALRTGSASKTENFISGLSDAPR